MAPHGKASFTGLFRRTLDPQNRLTIPSAWRGAFKDNDEFLIALQPGGHLAVLPPDQVATLHERMGAIELNQTELQDDAARYFAGTHSFTFDKQGRFIVPDTLLELAGIVKGEEDNVVMVGTLTKFNLYQPDQWIKKPSTVKFPELAESLRKLKL